MDMRHFVLIVIGGLGVYTYIYCFFDHPYPSPLPQCYDRYGNNTRYITFEYTRFRRLGNYMFSVASLIGIAKRNNMRPIFLADYASEYRRYSDAMDTWLPEIHSYCFAHFQKLTFQDVNSRQYDQRTENLLEYFGSQVTSNKTLIILKGYYQSWKYFSNSDERVRKILSLPSKIVSEAKLMFNNLIQEGHNMSSLKVGATSYKPKVVGIHIRRGDMADQIDYRSPNKTYYINAMSYYEKQALDSLNKVLFLVTSDNLTWARYNLHGKTNIVFSDAVSHREDLSAEADMALLSMCDDIIMSLGTYGWWAGYLTGGRVLYYKDWCYPGTKLSRLSHYEDMFPPTWLGIT